MTFLYVFFGILKAIGILILCCIVVLLIVLLIKSKQDKKEIQESNLKSLDEMKKRRDVIK